jgi:UDP-N-acetylglucosamine 3-dehydrogenase
MRLDYNPQQFWIEKNDETVHPRYPVQEPLKCELQHFVECITEKKTPLITGMDGVKALQVAEAAIESSAKNKAVEIKSLF